MTYIHYNHVRAREPLFPSDSEPFYSRPLVRRNSKRQRISIYNSDDDFDDYPPTVKPSNIKPTMSRALTVRRPSQLEKFNVFNTPSPDTTKDDGFKSHRSSNVHHYYVSRPAEHEFIETEDEYESDRVHVKVNVARPRRNSYHHVVAKEVVPMSWPADSFKRKEKWERVDWEAKEKKRSAHYHTTTGGYKFLVDDCSSDECEVSRDVRYRKLKRTRTDEWKPLFGFKRF